MQYQWHKKTLALPDAEQLSVYLNITEKIWTRPEEINAGDTKAFKELVLSLSPIEFTWMHIDILEKVFPEDWKAYQQFHFGTQGERGEQEHLG